MQEVGSSISLTFIGIRSMRKRRDYPRKETQLSLLCKRDEFIFRSPYSDSALATIKELHPSQRIWDPVHKVWRLAPTGEVMLHVIQLCQDYFRKMPDIHLHDNLSMDEIVEGKTLDLSTHYTTLGVANTATDKEIKKAYYRKAMQYHPDRQGPDEGKYFVAVNRAYECLMDPLKRKRYDAALRITQAKHNAQLGEYRASMFTV